MTRSFTSFLGNKRRQNPIHPAYFEALEPRQMLSATYSSNDLDGTWAVVSHTLNGTLVVEGGSIASATDIQQSGGSGIDDADLNLNINSNGTATFSAGIDGSIFALDGTVSSNKSILNLADSTGWDQTLLIRLADSYGNSDLAGTWTFSSVDTHGSLTFAYNATTGALTISGGSLKYLKQNTNGTYAEATLGFDKAKSTVSDIVNGQFTVILRDSQNNILTTLVGTLNSSKDTVAFSMEDPNAPISENPGNRDIAVAVKTGGSNFVATDLGTGTSGTTWFISGDTDSSSSFYGGLIISAPDSKGKFTISLAGNDDENPVLLFGSEVTGIISNTLTINKNGLISGNIVFATDSGNTTVTLTGQMNASKNTMVLYSTSKPGSLVLTTAVDHAATVAQANKTVVVDSVTKAEIVTMTFEEILSKAGISDIDGDSDITSLQIAWTSGTLYTVDAYGNETDISGTDFITLARGQSIKWIISPTAAINANTVAFKVKLTPDATTAQTASLAFKRISNTVTIAINKTSIAEDDSQSMTITLTRQIAEGDLTVAFTLGGTAVSGTDYVIKDSNGNILTDSITFTGTSKTVTIIITPIEIDDSIATGDRTVTLALSKENLDSKIYELASTSSVTGTIKGDHGAGQYAITVTTKSSQITEGNTVGASGSYADFTISRGSMKTSDLDLDISVLGIGSDQYILTYTDGTEITSGTITIADGQTSVVVRLKLLPDSVGEQTLVATFQVTIPSYAQSTYYFDGVKNTASVKIVDNEPVITIATVNAREWNGKSAVNGSFTISSSIAAPAEGAIIQFKLGGTATYASDYTSDFILLDSSGYVLTPDVDGVFTVTLAKGAKSATITVVPATDRGNESDETIEILIQGTSYVLPSVTPTVTIINRINAAPTASTGTITPIFTIGGTQTVTFDQIKTAIRASDDVDTSQLSIKITELVDGITLSINGNNLAVGDIIKPGDILTVTVDDDYKAAKGVTLFKAVAVDTENAVSAEVMVKATLIDEENNNDPTITNRAISFNLMTSSSTEYYIQMTYEELLAKTGAKDAEGDTITFEISKIEDGVTLYKIDADGNETEISERTDLVAGESLRWEGSDAGIFTSTSKLLFSIKTKDQYHLRKATATVSVTVPTISIKTSATTIQEGKTGTVTITRTGDLTNEMWVYFTIGGDVTSIDFDAYDATTLNGYGGSYGTPYLFGSNVLHFAAGESSQTITIRVAGNSDLNVAAKKLILTVTNGFYIKPATATQTINLTYVNTNIAPTLQTGSLGTLIATDYNTFTTNTTASNGLAAVLNFADTEDSYYVISLTVTSITAGVFIYAGSPVANEDNSNVVKAGTVLTNDTLYYIVFASNFAMGDNKTLFKAKAIDTGGASSATVDVKANVRTNHAPEVTAVGQLDSVTVNTSVSITYQDLLDLTDVTDSDSGDLEKITFRIESITTGITLKDGNKVLKAGDVIKSTSIITWAGSSTVSDIAGLELFKVKAFDTKNYSDLTTSIRILVESNIVPTLVIDEATLGPVNSNGTATITYEDLTNALSPADGDTGDTISFRIVSIASGITIKIGTQILKVGDFITKDTILTWKALSTYGDITLFTVKAFDGKDYSSETSTVIYQVQPNTVPTIATSGTVLSGTEIRSGQSVQITYNDIVSATTPYDADGNTIRFQISSIAAGVTLKIGNTIVQAGQMITSGTILTWASTAAHYGNVLLFTVRAYDGQDFSENTSGIHVNVTQNHAPQITATQSAGSTSPVTDVTISYQDIVDAISPTDADGDSIVFKIVSITNGVTLKVGTNTLTVGGFITSETLISWTSSTRIGVNTLFTVQAYDGLLYSTNTLAITYDIENDAPIIYDGTFPDINPGDTLTITYQDLLDYTFASDPDSDGGNLTFKVTSIGNIALKLNNQTMKVGDVITSTSVITWNSSGYSNPGTPITLFGVKAFDGYSYSDDAGTLSVSIAPANSVPTITNTGYMTATAPGTEVTFSTYELSTILNANDADYDTLRFKVISIGSGITLTVDGGTTLRVGDYITDETSITWSGSGTTGLKTLLTVKACDDVSESAVTATIYIPVVAAGDNTAPSIISGNTVLPVTDTGGTSITFTYQDIADATFASDDNGPISFVITSIENGVVLKIGSTTLQVGSTISAGQTVTWNRQSGSDNTVNLFSIVAFDGEYYSDNPSAIYIQRNTAPAIELPYASLSYTGVNQTLTFSIYDLIDATRATDADGDTLSFKITAIYSNVILRNGSTILTVGDFITEETTVITTFSVAGDIKLMDIRAFDGTDLSLLTATIYTTVLS